MLYLVVQEHLDKVIMVAQAHQEQLMELLLVVVVLLLLVVVLLAQKLQVMVVQELHLLFQALVLPMQAAAVALQEMQT